MKMQTIESMLSYSNGFEKTEVRGQKLKIITANTCVCASKKQNIMKRTICKNCNPNREIIIGVERNCSECGIELIHILNEK